MGHKNLKKIRIQKIRFRIRKKIKGTHTKPRLVPTISNKKIYLQLIDDTQRHTILGISVKGKNIKAATQAGQLIAKQAKTKKITQVVFDRAGKLYHGVTKTISEEARKAGLNH